MNSDGFTQACTMVSLLLTFVVILITIFYFIVKSRRKCRLPPGPKGIPIFGNLFQLDIKTFSTQLSVMAKDYGDACTVKLFNQSVVLFNTYDMIKEATTSQKYAKIFSGRPPTFVENYVAKGNVGLSTYSQEWVTLRKVVFRGLKTYGTHLMEVEELVQEELTHLIDRMSMDAGTAVDPYDYIVGYVASILTMLLTGQHHKHDDPLLHLCTNIARGVDSLLSPDVSAIMTSLPFLRHFPVRGGKVYKKLQQDLSVMKRTVYEEFANKKDSKMCFLEHVLAEKDLRNLTEENVNGVLVDMATGGTGTSQNSMYSLLLRLATEPKVQSRVQEEIDRVIGGSRLPCVEDKHKMPYTHAVVWEMLRLYPAVPLALPHCTMEDVEFRDYFIPKDTIVFFSVWNVHHDETFWKDAWTFNPSRFLDDQGNLVPPENEKRQRVIAFSLGKRQCIGEVLAKLRIFLAIVAILQKFTIRPDPDNPLPDADPRTFEAHLLLRSPRYKIVFHPRQQV